MLRLWIEELYLVGVEIQPHHIADLESLLWIGQHVDVGLADAHVHQIIATQRLNDVDLADDALITESYVLGTDAHDDCTLPGGLHAPVSRHYHVEPLPAGVVIAIFADNLHLQEIHRRVTHKAGNKECAWPVVQFIGSSIGLQAAILHDGNAVSHGHGFHLVVGDVDGGYAQFHLQAFDFTAHRQAQTSVQVRERLVEQEQVGLLDQRPPQSHALLLAARKLCWLAVHQVPDAHHISHPLRVLLHLLFRDLLKLERIADVLKDGHVGVEGVTLKNHADVAVLGRKMVHYLPVELNDAFRRFVNARYHQQCGGFPTSRGSQESDKLTIPNLQIDVVGSHHIAPALSEILKLYSHNSLLNLMSLGRAETG